MHIIRYILKVAIALFLLLTLEEYLISPDTAAPASHDNPSLYIASRRSSLCRLVSSEYSIFVQIMTRCLSNIFSLPSSKAFIHLRSKASSSRFRYILLNKYFLLLTTLSHQIATPPYQASSLLPQNISNRFC